MNARAQNDLEFLSTKLGRVRTDYERARSRGDAERICQFRLQLSAIVAERDRLMKRLSGRPASGPLGGNELSPGE